MSASKTHQEKTGQYDMPGFRPDEHYVRWMNRYGILPETFDATRDATDPSAKDKQYRH